ncbi:P-loop containing nucleoside triphosphate hydrolase protein [Sporormia fimetaria CBS 119925]|uniref:P-loop containing nucleoside triphosphate hydrolase protein n=1 Tax=Sporormia fimetaria CBS 119925 TaxID=1340428 RepID=A0A6A6V5W7_9PLEO|nr:P-loop containing nucleoside triphosphate hydrolase protein [Sporormia fimetaria CBS 119925]
MRRLATSTFVVAISPQARRSYLALSTIGRAFSTTSPRRTNALFSRNDFDGQGFVGSYEPGEPLHGPLSNASLTGAPRIIPKELKEHLDKYVVGQERAKKKLSTAIYNHYQRIEEKERRERELEALEAQAMRRELRHRERSQRHPVEDEFPGQQATVLYPPSPTQPPEPPSPPLQTTKLVDNSPMGIEKSNLLMLGPTGVGKTLMIKTLARVLDVPISMSNCTTFTQAGYIGEDVEGCVQRLLIAANYDIKAAEKGIVILDEFDKISAKKGLSAAGKDVAGEGVQQAFLPLLEGTNVRVTLKTERGAGGPKGPPGSSNYPPAQEKEAVYNVRTDNILFICSGAFVNLPKIILDRISKGSMGFGAHVRNSASHSSVHDSQLVGESALFRKHLPFYVQSEPQQKLDQIFNVLDLVQPADLQKFGLIPELLGRIPSLCSVTALDVDALVRVLTEPNNSLVSQYIQLFHNSGIELRITNYALREIAKKALEMETGARGLRTVLERLLEESMFEAPGSYVKHILVNRDAAQLKCAPLFFMRGQSHSFAAALAHEEDAYEEEMGTGVKKEHVNSFQEFRKQGYAVGAG